MSWTLAVMTALQTQTLLRRAPLPRICDDMLGLNKVMVSLTFKGSYL